jgi:hypothetical protein
MAYTRPDPTARQTRLDEVDISDLRWSSLDALVERLTELQTQGYTGFNAETHEEYGDFVVTINVTRQRPESDEEYATRMGEIDASRERRRQAYLSLKAEFEAS